MTNAEHIMAYIESDRPLYDSLLWHSRARKLMNVANRFAQASSIVTSAVARATRDSDMHMSDVTTDSIVEAIRLVLAWELEA